MSASLIEVLHGRYRAGWISPSAITETHLRAAHEIGGPLNAFTLVLDAEAREQALASERRYKQGCPRSVLDGVPITVKDLLAVAGHPTTAASKAADPSPETHDALVVSRLKDLGAVILGKTNLLEFADGLVHPDFGPARNPWHVTHTSGGSSSGSAVAVAAGIGLASIGTDTAGSVRNPAALCGTVGYKPAYGTLSTEGVFPLAPSLDHVGVLTRTARDARLIVQAILGEAESEGAEPLESAQMPSRIGILNMPGCADEVQDRVDAVVTYLREQGIETVGLATDLLAPANAAAMVIVYAEALSVHARRLGPRWNGYGVATRTRLVAGSVIGAVDYLEALRLRKRLRSELLERLHKAGLSVFLAPTLPSAATPLGHTVPLREAASFTSVQAVLGLPALSVPIGLGADSGLPVAIQMTAVPGREADLFALAAQVENARGPWPDPPLAQDPMPRQD